MQGTPRTMQEDPRYDDVVDDVRAFLAERIEAAVAAGIDEARIWVDPGIGFGKTVEHNLELLRRLGELRELGRPIVIGTSRKRFLGDAHRARGRRPARRHDRLERARARRRRRRVQGPRRRRAAPGARRRRGDPRPARDWRERRHRGLGTFARVEAHGEHESTVQVELRGLSIYTHHGVTDAEREIGQRLVIDVSFDVPDCDAVLTDRLEDTIDYSDVADIVVLAATERSYRTLERLGGVIGERLMERFGSDSVRVRAAKPEPPDPRRDRGGRGRGRARARARRPRRRRKSQRASA